nr:MAG TPA: hypothetical protein [Caudoviricetes sp.]
MDCLRSVHKKFFANLGFRNSKDLKQLTRIAIYLARFTYTDMGYFFEITLTELNEIIEEVSNIVKE